MIARAAAIPWAVPVDLKRLRAITAKFWVVGIHAPWDVIQKESDGALLVGLKRDLDTHRKSLERAGWELDARAKRIIKSLPDERTVNYRLLKSGDTEELCRLRLLTGIPNIRQEAWVDRYEGPYDWCVRTETDQ